MAGLELTHQEVQETLELQVSGGLPLDEGVQAHLRGCAECRAHLALLQEVQLALLEDVPAVAPPPELRAAIMAAARAQGSTDGAGQAGHDAVAHVTELPSKAADPLDTFLATTPSAGPAMPRSFRRAWWWPTALSAAAMVGALLLVGTVLQPSRGVAATLPNPAVVVNAGGPLVVASNDQRGTISVVQGERVTATMQTDGAQTAWFTEGVRLGDRVYLADAANDRVLEVQPRPLKVVRVYPVPDGVAGLTASSGPHGGRVYFKGVRGDVGQLGGKQITIAQEKGMPLADVMDGVLLAGGHLYVTHHVSGEICLLNPDTLAVEKRLKVGGMPVALAYVRGGVLALDVTGRLLRLDLQGTVQRQWKVNGHPDKLSVNGDTAVLTDRAGRVTLVNLKSGQVSQTKATHPMDVVSLPGGRFVVAEGGRGLRLLDGQLQTLSTPGQP